MTAQTLINSALRVIEAIPSGATPSAEESADGLEALNMMLDNWSAQGLPIPYLTRDAVSATGATSYSIGPTGATVTSARPLAIKSVAITPTGVALAVPYSPRSAAEYSATDENKVYFYDAAYPNGTLYLRPGPTLGVIELWSYKALAQLATLGTALSLPPGYERALKLNLAVDLAPEFGRPITSELASLANDAKLSIQGLNRAVLGDVPTIAPPAAGAAA